MYQNGCNIFPNDQRLYQPFPFQCPPKFTQIGILGLKINHLATLVGMVYTEESTPAEEETDGLEIESRLVAFLITNSYDPTLG
jgi:hypothetical protein